MSGRHEKKRGVRSAAPTSQQQFAVLRPVWLTTQLRRASALEQARGAATLSGSWWIRDRSHGNRGRTLKKKILARREPEAERSLFRKKYFDTRDLYVKVRYVQYLITSKYYCT